MPARERRRDLRAATAFDVRAEAEIAALREAAERMGRLHDWMQASRPVEPLGELPAVEAPPARAKRRLWPFGRRKADPGAERKAKILAELEASVAGRPLAVQSVREEAPASVPPRIERQRAAG
jgi:hypothetical protein